MREAYLYFSGNNFYKLVLPNIPNLSQCGVIQVKANTILIPVRKDHTSHVQHDTVTNKRDFTACEWSFVPTTASLQSPPPVKETVYQLAIPAPHVQLKLDHKDDIPGGGIVVYLKARSDSSSL